MDLIFSSISVILLFERNLSIKLLAIGLFVYYSILVIIKEQKGDE